MQRIEKKYPPYCVRCKRNRVLPKLTFMGDLPKERLSISKNPFNNSGMIKLDYVMSKNQN